MNKQHMMENMLKRYNEWNTKALIIKLGDFLFSCSQLNDHNNMVITVCIVFLKTDVQSAVFDLKFDIFQEFSH